MFKECGGGVVFVVRVLLLPSVYVDDCHIGIWVCDEYVCLHTAVCVL